VKKVGKFFSSYFSFKMSYMMVPGRIRGVSLGIFLMMMIIRMGMGVQMVIEIM